MMNLFCTRMGELQGRVKKCKQTDCCDQLRAGISHDALPLTCAGDSTKACSDSFNLAYPFLTILQLSGRLLSWKGHGMSTKAHTTIEEVQPDGSTFKQATESQKKIKFSASRSQLRERICSRLLREFLE